MAAIAAPMTSLASLAGQKVQSRQAVKVNKVAFSVQAMKVKKGINKAKKGGAPNTGVSEAMNKKGWVDASGREGKVSEQRHKCDKLEVVRQPGVGKTTCALGSGSRNVMRSNERLHSGARPGRCFPTKTPLVSQAAHPHYSSTLAPAVYDHRLLKPAVTRATRPTAQGGTSCTFQSL